MKKTKRLRTSERFGRLLGVKARLKGLTIIQLTEELADQYENEIYGATHYERKRKRRTFI